MKKRARSRSMAKSVHAKVGAMCNVKSQPCATDAVDQHMTDAHRESTGHCASYQHVLIPDGRGLQALVTCFA